MDFTSRYKKLNQAQKQAVDTIDGPVMVIAGPGTGKTELLSMRAANILRQTDALPESILCLTFTESGAAAMRGRLASIIGPAAYRVAIHTFHSFGTEVINQNGAFFYNGAQFSPADDLSGYELLRGAFDELGHKNPLAATMNDEYTYLQDTASIISELKRNGFTPEELRRVLDANDAFIAQIEPQLAVIFANRISKTTAGHLASAAQTAHDFDTSIVAVPALVTPLAEIFADSLEYAVRQATETGKTTPITTWKNAWLKKNDAGSFILKTHERQTKLRSVANIYEQYLLHMRQESLFDFDDMILRVVHAMEVFPDLRLNLQERYQYIMVDEFQDTNMAQMRILYSLTDNEINNGRPNILAVGDDDQAIYSFQGADIGNIHAFNETFVETQRIVLTDNYRSTESILSAARSVITLGNDRLETRFPELDKTLTPHLPDVAGGVSLIEAPAIHDERAWVAASIRASIDTGTSPSSIAVLARRHHELVALLPYLADAGINVNYERRDNVLDLEPVKIIESIAHLIVALYEQRHDDADTLLPELLAHPAFAIAPHELWQLSLKASQDRQSWLQIMETTPTLQPIQHWLIDMTKQVAHTPLEYMLDHILGTPDNAEPKGTFASPFFDYFFSTKQLELAPDTYLTYLEALQTIRSKLREYQPNETPTLQSFLEFMRLHNQLERPITSTRPKGDHIAGAINLMTAHKSKGLEFATVYVMGAVDTSWGERVRSRSRLIGYPENMPLAPVGDTIDERLRLFFVAMTRAKQHLFISYSKSDNAGKDLLPASFLMNETWTPHVLPKVKSIDTLVKTAQLEWYQPVITPISPSMRSLLASKLESYKLSSTHLANFLDITRGGPQSFLVRNLLRFPQAMPPSAAYGSAIHATLQRTHAHLAATGSHRPLEDILQDYEQNLRTQNMSEEDFTLFLQKGSDTLSSFLEQKYESFARTQKVELNFAHQAVFLGDAHLTGSLDLVDFDGQDIIVTDYKTGKPSRNWTGKTDYEKIKLHRYRQQLMFYNLLVANSRDYRKYMFKKGVLQFVEPTISGEIVAIDATFTSEDLQQFTRLIQRVWHRIITLDLPDTSNYEPNYKGILAFEQDLLDEI
jgi:DNA helicase-2/ATP-dependent DNA helicase PcrA